VQRDPRTGQLGSTAEAMRNFLRLGVKNRLVGRTSGAATVVRAAAASVTKRIRLGSAVTVLSTHDPVRVYQQFATLDSLSNGRAEITAGRGSSTESLPLFGFSLEDYDELDAEKLDLLLKINAAETVTWSGNHRPALQGRAGGAASGLGFTVDLAWHRWQSRIVTSRWSTWAPDYLRDHRRRRAGSQGSVVSSLVRHHRRGRPIGSLPHNEFLRSIELLGRRVKPLVDAELGEPALQGQAARRYRTATCTVRRRFSSMASASRAALAQTSCTASFCATWLARAALRHSVTNDVDEA
jgi:hypothetical protein